MTTQEQLNVAADLEAEERSNMMEDLKDDYSRVMADRMSVQELYVYTVEMFCDNMTNAGDAELLTCVESDCPELKEKYPTLFEE